MTEPGISAPASPSDVGRHLRAVRKARGLSRSEVARSAGLTRRELAAYERGRSPVPDSDLWCLAGSCGVDVGDLLPPAGRVSVGSDLGALTVGESVARLRPTAGNDGVLREYLAMVYELRNLPPGAKPPMREEDLATLAEALGGTPEAIEVRLHELIGASREEAARLRSLILPPRPIAAPAPPVSVPVFATAPAPPVPVGAAVGAGAMYAAPPAPTPPTAFPAPPVGATPVAAPAPTGAFATPAAAPPPPTEPWYPPPAFDFAAPSTGIGDPAAADRFFAAPHADDPFAPPPPLEALVAPGPAFAAPPDAAATAFPTPNASPAGAFAPPIGPAFDPFAPPSGPPLAPAPAAPPPVVNDPFAPSAGTIPTEPVRPEGFVADLGTDPPDATLAPFTASAYDPPFAPDSEVDGPWAVGADPAESFGATEMVVLDVGPDGLVVDGPGPWAADEAGPADPFGADLGDDDPLAILRIPIDEVAADDHTVMLEPSPLGDATFGTGDARGAADPFADAFDEPYDAPGALAHPGDTDGRPDPFAMPAAGHDDDPGDDWFDRAAAAADALIAEQRHDEPTSWDDLMPDDLTSDDLTSDDLTSDELDAAGAEDRPIAAVAAADPWAAEPVEPVEAVEAVEGEPPSATEREAPTVIGPEPPTVDPTEAGPPPIAWSLSPPPDAPVTAPTLAVAAPSEQFVAAGPDWQVGGIFPATAMADDGALALRRADVRWALADVVAEGDFTIRATVSFTSGAGFGLLFRVSTDESERITGYSFDVDPIYSGGGFLVRQWNDSRQHWKPLAHAPIADTARLYGAHVVEVSLRHDTLTASIDGESVMHVAQLSRSSIDAGHEPCRGGRIGVQAWSTTEVTVDKLLVAHH